MKLRLALAVTVSAATLAFAAPAFAQDAAPLPEMTFGTWGVDLTQIDPAVDPGDNFNAYVNGKWTAATEIPADRVRFGPFDLLREKSTQDVRDLVNELVATNPAPGTPERRIVDAYQAFMDEDAINAAGLTPIMPYLTTIWQAPDLEALATLFQQPGYPGLVGAGVGIDSRNPDAHAVSVGFAGMGMPTRDYYLVDSSRNEEVRDSYMLYLTFMLAHAGYADPAAAADAVYAFEHKVAELEWANQIMRVPELTYNRVTREELLGLVPAFPMARILEEGDFADQTSFIVPQLPPTPEEITALGLGEEEKAMIGGGLPAMMQLLLDTDLATIKAFMTVQALNANAAVLPRVIDETSFAFYGTVLNGQEQQQDRWKRAIGEVEGMLGEQLGAQYVARHFPPNSKAQMDELVANLRRAMGSFIDANGWMTPDTIAEARTKLSTFDPMIGYPAQFETYTGLEIVAGNPLANRIAATRWAIADAHAKLGQPVDRSEWGMLPQTVNAYYSPLTNQIVFPAAILQAPFFDGDADPAVNYGAIGAIIGHEIGHGFDDTGSQYDSTGALRNWWTEQDRAGFVALNERMATLIAAYCPLDEGTTCLNPALAMGETLGDVVGLQMAYRAFRLSLGDAEAPVVDGLTGDQRFLLGFAQVWRAKQREGFIRSQIVGGTHPPGEFRLNNSVRHLDAWYTAFDVGPDDALYLPPEQRITIW